MADWRLLPGLVLSLVFWVGAEDCSKLCQEAPAVETEDGCLCGKMMPGLDGPEFDAFLGVPYAKPPVGKLRFANPVPSDPFEGFYNASYSRSECIQKNELVPMKDHVSGDEDCLYLNVYRPLERNSLLPVMVYIHGGGFISGNAHPQMVGPEKFMDTGKVLMVTVQYRLGAFGFFSTGDKYAPGNFGLKDQSLALRWVQNNIERFGGDPEKVTIFGTSAGASSVQLHMMSPLSRGLFSRAILSSGSALAHWSRPFEKQLFMARDLAEAAGFRSKQQLTSKQIVESLRKVKAADLIETMESLKYWDIKPTILFRPVVEEHWDEETFMKEDPRKLWADGFYEKVPWMTGFLPNEGAVFSVPILSNITRMKQFIENEKSFIPLLSGTPRTSTNTINRRFFNGEPMNKRNADGLSKLVSESAFLYPMIRSVRQHVDNGFLSDAPVTVFYFNFRGRYHMAPLFAGALPFKDYGICHGEELPYLFRMSEAFPDADLDSPEMAMSRELINVFVGFAYEGTLTPDFRRCHRCDLSKKVGFVEFTNSQDGSPRVSYLGPENVHMKRLNEIYDWWSAMDI
ncbi:juvenile hormone esterase-like [Uranotaenia lowii]|uniref:juvenile hormone esterase-like n=1 Tax=Uranotaenia lowii TaxID=190385 RepID=UPI002478A788|nr:juvenile hormone esterase-like [Uranotaenia lowii]